MAAVWARSSSRCMTAHAGGAIGVSIVRSERVAVDMARIIQENSGAGGSGSWAAVW